MLSRAVTGSPDSDQLQKATLYRAMQDIGGFTKLDLDYGDFNGNDQDWQNIPGEEVVLSFVSLLISDRSNEYGPVLDLVSDNIR